MFKSCCPYTRSLGFYSSFLLIIVVLVLFFSISITAAADIELGTILTKLFPSSSNLSKQFASITERQIGGTCHIYAATALLESACFRATGKRTNISEAYFINRHLNKNSSQLKQGIASFSDYEITSFDGGQIDDTIQRAFDGNVCTEAEFPIDKKQLLSIHFFLKDQVQAPLRACRPFSFKNEFELKGFINGLKASALKNGVKGPYTAEQRIAQIQLELAGIRRWLAQSYSTLSRVEKQFIQALYLEKIEAIAKLESELKKLEGEISNRAIKTVSDQLNQQVKEMAKKSNLLTSVKKTGEAILATNDQDLRACLSHHLRFRTEAFSVVRALDLLSSGTPFVCVGMFKLPEGELGMHGSVTVGYRFNKKFSRGVEFLQRDSNNKRPTWGWELNCDQIAYIEVDSLN